MKVELNASEIKYRMRIKSIKSYKELASECKFNIHTFYNAKSRKKCTESVEMLCLIADKLECKLEDIIDVKF